MGILNDIALKLQEGDAKEVKVLVQKALDEGIAGNEILEKGLLVGMDIIGEQFKNNEVFIPEVLLAAKAMNQGTKILKGVLAAGETVGAGKAVIGTVAGDLHDIGKNLVKLMMEGKGIEVIDLGADVKPIDFYETAIKEGAQLVCCSALLTTTMTEMKNVVDLFVQNGNRDKVTIMVGGAPISEKFCKDIGADIYTPDAASAATAARAKLQA